MTPLALTDPGMTLWRATGQRSVCVWMGGAEPGTAPRSSPAHRIDSGSLWTVVEIPRVANDDVSRAS